LVSQIKRNLLKKQFHNYTLSLCFKGSDRAVTSRFQITLRSKERRSKSHLIRKTNSGSTINLRQKKLSRKMLTSSATLKLLRLWFKKKVFLTFAVVELQVTPLKRTAHLPFVRATANTTKTRRSMNVHSEIFWRPLSDT
jgi:hypothetical protein